MKQVAIVYWSGTGNTEQMAEILAEGVKAAGGQAEVLLPDAVNEEKLDACDAIAFGCPSMGDEALEEAEFEPMFENLESGLSGRPVALFGSYGWGDGGWMREWESRVKADGAKLLGSVIANYEPDDEARTALEELANKLTA